jgi:hypothetical protein
MNEFDSPHLHAPPEQAAAKRFTVEQANRTLPLVRRILGDVVAQYQLVERIQRRRRILARSQRLEELAAAEAQGVEAAWRLSDLMRELASLGCQVRDYEQGCVDFPALRDGREVFLCWQLNEERIAYWHEKHTGENGRRPLDA